MVNTENQTLWDNIVREGNFIVRPAPFGIKIKFMQEVFMINFKEGRRIQIALFNDRLYGAYRARLQISVFGGEFFSIISQQFVSFEGYPISGVRTETEVMYGNPSNPNPNYKEGMFYC